MKSGQLARSPCRALRGTVTVCCWRADLLKDEPVGQPAIALKER